MSARRYERHDESAAHFFQIEVINNIVRTHSGKIGNKGRIRAKECRSAKRASALAAERVQEKLAAGYIDVGDVADYSTELLRTSDSAEEIIADQLQRLEFAMLSGTRFTVAELNELVEHPALTELARQLVWGIYEADLLTASFRVAEDNTLADVNDEPVTLAPNTVLGLPQPGEFEPALRINWAELFADYELAQTFDQLGRHQLRLEYRQGTSSKFWEIEVVGRRLITTWGRIGTQGQQKVTTFKTTSDAHGAAETRTDQKLARGYTSN